MDAESIQIVTQIGFLGSWDQIALDVPIVAQRLVKWNLYIRAGQ